ncbi:MAG: NAD(P)/FAD-dependent oxidoreductase [candidate division Zixibacteria bacterium]|nr:NAD(P)/FAD-dependent oxidoreductase [candidate division Zixibacteria bacterium]
MKEMHQVVIIGGGFGGLYAARMLAKEPVAVTLIDRRNYHLFQPLLYQVATAGLSPADIATPLRHILRKQRNARVLMGEAVDICPDRREVILNDGLVSYDTLIVATGAGHHYFNHDEWEPLALGLKTIENALAIRSKILLAFEAAERVSRPDDIDQWLTFVVVGAGPTGVELAGAVAELARDTLRKDFTNIDPSRSRIVLVEATDRIMPTYPDKLVVRSERALSRLGVTIMKQALVTDIQPHQVMVHLAHGDETISARTVLWAAGVKASPLARKLAEGTGASTDRAGRILVDACLRIPGHADIFAIGDIAHCSQQDGNPLPGVAPVAMQQGKYVAKTITAALKKRPVPNFRYRDYGRMATIGRSEAVADFGKITLWGMPGWLAWLFIHLMYLVEFENRILVLIQWAWNYLTYNRSARLITGKNVLPFRHDPVSEKENDQ